VDFFEHQDQARRNTGRLIALLSLAVLALIALTSLLFSLARYLATPSQTALNLSQGNPVQSLMAQLDWVSLAWIAGLVSFAVVLGSLFKWLQLRSGGRAVAEALGGRLIPPNTDQAEERQLLNIVEEMAIAAGTAVPPVYLMDESGINAFAAGHSPRDAVIGITRGSLEQLNRDQLQGVIAHEFSHILQGDMRLNLRLVAMLNGILIIGLLGRLLLRSGSGYRRGLRRRGGHGGVVVLGLGLMLLGALGSFFGNWIKAAVSRQREFLADASAVQYTRNPHGIAGALQKIGGLSGSELQAPDADEFSHMYFSAGITHHLSRLMATHPPLKERIQRILPNWQGDLSEPTPAAASSETAKGFAAQPNTAPSSGDEGAAQPGEPGANSINGAQTLLAGLSPALRTASRDPLGAQAVLFGLLLCDQAGVKERQWLNLEQHFGPGSLKSLKAIIDQSAESADTQRLALIELTLPALKQASDQQRQALLDTLDALIRADGRVRLREWSLSRIVRHHLQEKPQGRERLRLTYCRDEARLLLSLAACCGARSKTAAQTAYQAGASRLGEDRPMLAASQISLAHLDPALERLTLLKPLEKPSLLKALKACLMADNTMTPTEAELFRALAEAFDCPTPPMDALNLTA